MQKSDSCQNSHCGALNSSHATLMARGESLPLWVVAMAPSDYCKINPALARTRTCTYWRKRGFLSDKTVKQSSILRY